MYLNFKHLILSILVVSAVPMKNRIMADDFFRRPESLQAVPSQTSETKVNDVSIVKRIVAAYQRSAAPTENRGNSMWKEFFHQRHEKLHKVFMSGNLNTAAHILRNPHTTDLFYGFDNLAVSILPIFESAAVQQGHATTCLDGLIRCAEAIGVIPLDNPENYTASPPVPWKADAIIDKLRQVFGKPIIFPNPYPSEHGLNTSYGIVSYRVPQAIYQAYRIKQLLGNITNPRVLEIGAGLGRTAYFARLLGIKDYTIVDIPFTALSSGYFLGCILGEDQIVYSGEQAPNAQERIKILNPEEFLSSNNRYDLIINTDGFTEMDQNIARSYWKKIEKCTPIFLSINHENNSYRVRILIDESKNIISAERHLYWMRKGYVEEVVRFK